MGKVIPFFCGFILCADWNADVWSLSSHLETGQETCTEDGGEIRIGNFSSCDLAHHTAWDSDKIVLMREGNKLTSCLISCYCEFSVIGSIKKA